MSLFNKLLEFFGFGGSVEKPNNFERLLEDLSSSKRHDEAKQSAFQAIQSGDDISPDRIHPSESVLRSDSLAVETACTHHHTEILKKTFGDAQYLSVLIQSGLQSELSQTSPREIQAKIQAEITQKQAEASNVLEQFKQAEKDLEIFKGANGITSSAQIPEKNNAIYLLLAIGIIEALFNAWFLRGGINPITSILIAIAVAVINVGGNVWLGERYRYKNHIKPEIAKSALLNRIYCFALIMGLNGLVAFYRLWYASSSNSLSGQFIFESTILFIVGIAMGVAAFHKGYALDDPYPGYGAYARRLQEWAMELTKLRKNHAEFCIELKKKADLTLDSLDSKIITASERFSSQLPEMAQQLNIWESDHGKINYAYRQLQEVFKMTMLSFHPKGKDGYPQEILDLPENAQLNNYKNQVSTYLDRKDNLKNQINALREEVKKQRDTLHKWWQHPDTVELLGFPK